MGVIYVPFVQGLNLRSLDNKMLMDIGRVCIKIAGRDAGNYAVVIDNIDDNYVIIDGYVRRKRCNIKHLEPTSNMLKITKKASTEEVKKALDTIKIKVKKDQKFIKNFKPKKEKEEVKKPLKKKIIKNNAKK